MNETACKKRGLSVGRARQKNIEGWAHKHFEALRAQK